MTCSFAWDEAELPAWGTAPRAAFWLAVEQNGPWGNKAFTQSRLDPAVGGAIEEAALAAGGRALLIRHPASHADHADHPLRRVYLAGGLDAKPWLLGGLIEDPEQLLELPFEILGSADPERLLARFNWLERQDGGLLLVCANAKRDLCCALRGRPIALALERLRPRQVWECTHTGGHRFAPTAIVLPAGQALARLTPEVAFAALQAAGSGILAAETFGPWHDRGRGHLSPACAVAEARVRQLTGECDPAALVTRPVADDAEVEVTHADGRTWTARLELRQHAQPLPESCVKLPIAAHGWYVLELTVRCA